MGGAPEQQIIVSTPFADIPASSGFWGFVNEFLRFLVETEVSLLTVVVLFLAYGARELIGFYLKWRTGKS